MISIQDLKYQSMLQKSHKNRLYNTLDIIKMLYFNAEIMHNLMMDLLDLAQIENSTFKLNKSFFSLPNAIR